MASTDHKYFHFIAIIVFLSITTSDAFDKTRLGITNSLDPGVNLKFHCKSADKGEDLGEQTLEVGRYYEYSFHPNSWYKKTIYSCEFKWPEKVNVVHSFDIYDQNRDENKCKLCQWSVKNDGPCRKSNGIDFEVCFKWK
ncbi:hypothetical protein ACFE04_029440 [Oxalis oulophora]